MPTYDYRCTACGHAFEHFQAISAALLRKCPQCGKPKLERLIGTGGGLLFKGSGFYITDYRSSSYKEAQKKDAAPAAPSKAEGSAEKSSGGAAPSTPASPSGSSSAPSRSKKGKSSPSKSG